MSNSFTKRAGLLALVAAAGLVGCQKSATNTASTETAAPSGYILTSDEVGDTVTVLDASTGAVVKTIDIGQRPRGVVLSPDGTKAYVAVSGDPIAPPGVDASTLPPPDRSKDGIGVINLADFSVGTKFKAGNDPEAFSISEDGTEIYVSNEDTKAMSVINVSTGQTRVRIPVGEEPEGTAVRPGSKIVYVACEASDAVYVVDLSQSKVISIIKMDGRPRAVAFTKDGSTAYVTNENSGHVTVIDATSNTIRTVIDIPDQGPVDASVPGVTPAQTGPRTTAPAAGVGADAAAKGGSVTGSPTQPKPMGVVMAPDGAHVYVSTGRGAEVAEIDTAANTVSRTFKNVGARPWSITISADGKTLYTANGPGDEVAAIDIASGMVAHRWPAGASPWGVAYVKKP